MELPRVLAQRVERVVKSKAAFHDLPIAQLCANRASFLHVIEEAWELFASGLIHVLQRGGKEVSERSLGKPEVAFDDPDIRAIVDSMLLDGTLRPLPVSEIASRLPP